MTDELPVYTVTSSNWTLNVPMDEYNAQFEISHQVMEAGTRAVEAFKGLRDLEIQMNPDSEGDEPYLGTTILVHPSGTNPEDAAIVFTHVCLANMGFYKESTILGEVLEKQLDNITNKQMEEEMKRKEEIEASLKLFDSLKKEIEKKQQEKKTPKTRRKKKDDGI